MLSKWSTVTFPNVIPTLTASWAASPASARTQSIPPQFEPPASTENMSHDQWTSGGHCFVPADLPGLKAPSMFQVSNPGCFDSTAPPIRTDTRRYVSSGAHRTYPKRNPAMTATVEVTTQPRSSYPTELNTSARLGQQTPGTRTFDDILQPALSPDKPARSWRHWGKRMSSRTASTKAYTEIDSSVGSPNITKTKRKPLNWDARLDSSLFFQPPESKPSADSPIARPRPQPPWPGTTPRTSCRLHLDTFDYDMSFEQQTERNIEAREIGYYDALNKLREHQVVTELSIAASRSCASNESVNVEAALKTHYALYTNWLSEATQAQLSLHYDHMAVVDWNLEKMLSGATLQTMGLPGDFVPRHAISSASMAKRIVYGSSKGRR